MHIAKCETKRNAEADSSTAVRIIRSYKVKKNLPFHALFTATAAVDVCGPRGGGLTRPRHALEAHLGREVVLIIGSNRVKIAPWVPRPRPVAHAYEAQCHFSVDS